MIVRSGRSKAVPLNIVGSSVFGRYPKISVEKTLNMFESDGFMVPYAGYQIGVPASFFGNAVEGRGCHASTKLGVIIAVFDNRVYSIKLNFNQQTLKVQDVIVVFLGNLQTSTGVVYITENNKPQIVLSDGELIYYYDPSLSPSFQIAYQDTNSPPTQINFEPGYIDFHDTYILCAASNDQSYTPAANNTWRLGIIDPNGSGKLIFPTTLDGVSYVGLIETKPDNTQAIVRFPSRGNMILVLGQTVTEPWFDTGSQLFPYQRNNQYNIDYGCINPATVASMDEIVCWLAQNEKSGPIIVYSTGGPPQKITTDGIDYLFSNLTAPQDSQGFMYRQDGHLFYHINFYTDNLSLFYDFNTGKFYHASDQNFNYFIAGEVSFFNNQYYFTTKNDGNLYIFDTIYTTYSNQNDSDGNPITFEQPRIRICRNIRDETQQYFIANDVGFTIETGETNYEIEDIGPIYLITQDGKFIVTQGDQILFVTQDDNYIQTQDYQYIASQQINPANFSYLIDQNDKLLYQTPAVDLSISIDGGATFGNEYRYELPPIGHRKNRLMWWRLGAVNDLVCQFKFWGIGRFVATNGVVNIRQ